MIVRKERNGIYSNDGSNLEKICSFFTDTFYLLEKNNTIV